MLDDVAGPHVFQGRGCCRHWPITKYGELLPPAPVTTTTDSVPRPRLCLTLSAKKKKKKKRSI